MSGFHKSPTVGKRYLIKSNAFRFKQLSMNALVLTLVVGQQTCCCVPIVVIHNENESSPDRTALKLFTRPKWVAI